MVKVKKLNNAGQAGIELLFLISLIALVTITSLLALRDAINSKYDDVSNEIVYNGDFGLIDDLITLADTVAFSNNGKIFSFGEMTGLKTLIEGDGVDVVDTLSNYEFRLNNQPVCVSYDKTNSNSIPYSNPCTVDVGGTLELIDSKDVKYVIEENTNGEWVVTFGEDIVSQEGCSDLSVCYDPSWSLTVHDVGTN
jgi:Flp pilus assembly pilin Flp